MIFVVGYLLSRSSSVYIAKLLFLSIRKPFSYICTIHICLFIMRTDCLHAKIYTYVHISTMQYNVHIYIFSMIKRLPSGKVLVVLFSCVFTKYTTIVQIKCYNINKRPHKLPIVFNVLNIYTHLMSSIFRFFFYIDLAEK